MFKKIIACLSLLGLVSAASAMNDSPTFTLLPNIKTQYLMSVNASEAASIENQSIELVKRTLNITSASPYKNIRIRTIYNNKNQVEALIVYLLSSQFKSFELVRINLNDNFTVASVIKNYTLQPDDLMQSPNYAHKYVPTCPDSSVQFVIGNNFTHDESVEKEVQKVYQMAKEKGYNPVLMDTNNPDGPQPTVQAYENWLSCPNVKGFYNESHGWEQGILLSDDDFTYSIINQDLIGKLNHEIILFDSCETFHDPLLSAVTKKQKGDAQQYIAGFISLPFGPSERTASCIWSEAFNHQDLNQKMIETCAKANNLQLDGYKIKGNGDTHLPPAV